MSDKATGTLYLIPVALGGDNAASLLPTSTIETARTLRTFIVENAKSARGFLKAIAHPGPLQELNLRTLDEHTRDIAPLLAPLLAGEDCGLMSEAGCPAVADPGAALVRRAHHAGVRVVPLVGPSSVLLALMASGMNGQRFAFHGYLPVEPAARARRIKELEKRSGEETQIFIETPYRNDALLAALLEVCAPGTLLCVASDLTLPSEDVRTRIVADWRGTHHAIGKRPTVFLLLAG